MTEPGNEPERRRGAFFLNVVPSALYIAAIFYAGTAPVTGSGVRHADKLMHLLAFAVMVFVVRRAVAYVAPALSPRGVLIASAILATALGGALEIVQLLATSRSAELLDFLADAVGAFAAAALLDRLTPREAEQGASGES